MIGQSIGGYEIVSKLGEGGMGAVYLGEHRRIARKAAIKVLLSDLSGNAEILTRFFNEARATSMIRHPGIVEILDCDVLPDGNAYIVMEYLEGESLSAALARLGRLPTERALALARQVADALAAAHERGIVHRDLKPDNLFLPPLASAAGASAAGASGQTIKILDFGIAKLMSPDALGGQLKTHTGRVLGTPAYMSPEQCRGAREIDHRTDVYSLACILFEMLCGRPPFTDPGFGQLIYAHLSTVPPRVRSIDPTIDPAVDGLVARMLAKSPAERPQTMRDVVAEIDRIAPGAPVRLSVRTPVATAMFGSPRVMTPVGASPVGPRIGIAPPVTAPLAPPPTVAAAAVAPPKPQTTFRSAASEKMPAAALDDWPAEAQARRGGRGPLLAVAVAAAVVVVGVGTWRMRSAPRPDSRPVASAAAATPAPVAPAPAPSAVAPAPPAAPGPSAVAPAPPAALAAPAPAVPVAPASAPQAVPAPSIVPPTAPTAPAAPSAPAAPAAARSRTVKVEIVTDPPGADVCLARDGILLGKTKYEWSTEKSSRVAKLWVRKEGYRGQDVSVAPRHDTRKQVTLKRLGVDDLEDTEGCHRP